MPRGGPWCLRVFLPLHFIGDFSPGSLITALVLLLIVSVSISLLIGVFLRGTHGSILAVALLHTVFNKSNNGDGIVAALVTGNARSSAALLATIVLTITAAHSAKRKLSQAEGIALKAARSTDPPAGSKQPRTARGSGPRVPVLSGAIQHGSTSWCNRRSSSRR